MRICTHIPTARIVEAQSNARAGTLINNMKQHFPVDELVEEVITDVEYEARMSAQQPPPIDLSDVDNQERAFKALVLMMRDYCNDLKAGTYATKTIAGLKADFRAKWNALS
jgi:hypothetical protein